MGKPGSMGQGSAASWLFPYAGQPPRGTTRRSLTDGKGWFCGTRQRGELAFPICGTAAARNYRTRLDEWETLVSWDQAASDTEGAPGWHSAACAHEASCALPRYAGARSMWSERRISCQLSRTRQEVYPNSIFRRQPFAELPLLPCGPRCW